jgi:hypothetical protein
VVHRGPGGQFGLQPVEGRRGAPGAGRVPGVGGQVPQRQDAPAGRVAEAGRAVHGQEVEEDRVAGLQGEPADIERAGSASMSGSSATLPSGNQRACRVRNVRGISRGPRCEPARSSRLPPSGTGSTAIQALTPCPSTL